MNTLDMMTEENHMVPAAAMLLCVTYCVLLYLVYYCV